MTHKNTRKSLLNYFLPLDVIFCLGIQSSRESVKFGVFMSADVSVVGAEGIPTAGESGGTFQLREDDRLGRVIQAILRGDSSAEGGGRRKGAHMVMKWCVGPVVGYVGRLPFMQMSMKVAGSNHVLGVCFAIGTDFAFGSLVTDCWQQLSDELFSQPKGRAAQELPTAVQVVSAACSLFMGLATQVPFAYAAHRYNAPPWDLVAPVAVLVCDSWVYVFSTFKLVQRLCLAVQQRYLLQQRALPILGVDSQPKVEEKLLGISKKIYAQLDNNEQILLGCSQERRKEIAAEFQAAIAADENVPGTLIKLLLQNGLSRSVPAEERGEMGCMPSYCCEREWFVARAIRSMLRVFGVGCALVNMWTLMTVSWDETKHLTGSESLSYTAAAVYAGSALYINMVANFGIADVFTDLVTGHHQCDLPHRLSRTLAFVLYMISLLSVAFSYGPSLELVRDYLGPDRVGGHTSFFASICVCYATTSLVSTASIAIIDKLLEVKIKSTGSSTAKSLLLLLEKLRELKRAVVGSSAVDVARLVGVGGYCGDELRDVLLDEVDLAANKVEEYLLSVGATEQTPLLPAV